MDMAVNEDQLAAELKNLRESLTDFRNEMRTTLNGFVRSDVYAAQQETTRAQQETMRAQQAADMEKLRGDISELRSSVKRLDDDKRQSRGVVWGAFASAAVALLVSFFRSG